MLIDCCVENGLLEGKKRHWPAVSFMELYIFVVSVGVQKDHGDLLLLGHRKPKERSALGRGGWFRICSIYSTLRVLHYRRVAGAL